MMNQFCNGASIAILCLASIPAYAGITVADPGTLAVVIGAIAAAVFVRRLAKKK